MVFLLKYWRVLALAAVVVFMAAAFYMHGKHEYQAGKDSVAAQILELTQERDALRVKAEKKIIEERIVYRERLKVIERSTDSCIISDDILRVLADAGIYIGPMRETDVQ